MFAGQVRDHGNALRQYIPFLLRGEFGYIFMGITVKTAGVDSISTGDICSSSVASHISWPESRILPTWLSNDSAVCDGTKKVALILCSSSICNTLSKPTVAPNTPREMSVGFALSPRPPVLILDCDQSCSADKGPVRRYHELTASKSMPKPQSTFFVISIAE